MGANTNSDSPKLDIVILKEERDNRSEYQTSQLFSEKIKQKK